MFQSIAMLIYFKLATQTQNRLELNDLQLTQGLVTRLEHKNRRADLLELLTIEEVA